MGSYFRGPVEMEMKEKGKTTFEGYGDKAVTALGNKTMKQVEVAQRENTEGKACFLSLLTFGFLSDIFADSVDRPLQQNDVYRIQTKDTANVMYKQFRDCWEAQKLKGKKPSAWACVFNIIGLKLWVIALLLLAQAASGIVVPYVIEAILVWIYTPAVFCYPAGSNIIFPNGTTTYQVNWATFEVPTSPNSVCEYRQDWDGYKWGIAFFALSFFGSCMYTWGMYIADIYDMKLKGAISHAIFQKSLRVQTVSQKLVETEEEMKKREKSIQKGKNDMASATSTGKIINLMTNDTNNVSMLPMSVTNILIVPVQVGVLLYLIHDTIGDAIFVGLSVIVAMIPITGLLLVFLIKYTTRLNKVMDNRVKISNETLQGIRVVKFYGWEKSLRKKIFQIRDEELGWLFKQVFVSTVCCLLC